MDTETHMQPLSAISKDNKGTSRDISFLCGSQLQPAAGVTVKFQDGRVIVNPAR